MKAQIVTLNILTKDISINSEENKNKNKLMALIKKFRIKSYKGEETIVELKNLSVFYNKRQI